MKVILQRDVPKVGRGGDIVTVADGYARNYLFPRQYAVPATGGYLKHHEARNARLKAVGDQQHQQAEQQAEKLAGVTATILGKVGSGTKLYGSVTAQDVSEAIMRATGIEIDKRRIGLVDPIKSLGVYSVPVRLGSDHHVTVNVDVTTEAELERRAAEAEAQAAAEAGAQAIEAD
ncbi:MAG: 50S ribosomal protein L9 [Chthonomonadales bacterium]|nr:50S ribosomal protein L9 [Chthonomonadales bacterium]